MQQYDNPFSMRASEKMTADDVFISLFSEASLYSLRDSSDKGRLWGNLTYICSAAGGGKTTMLRCFWPAVIQKVFNNQKQNDKLFKVLKGMGVVTNGKIQKCAAYLLTSRNYADLEDEEVFTKPQARRLLFALLNARFALAAIKALQLLTNYEYDQLDGITFKPSLELSNKFAPTSAPHTAKELFDWAAGIEEQITNIIETYETFGERPGHDSLFILRELHASDFTIKDKPIVDDFIFQLDDCHKLSNNQLEFLRQELIESRINNTVWLAMRYDKFTYKELMAKTDMIGRDYNLIRLEQDNKYDSMLGSIMEKRSNVSSQDIKLNHSLEQNPVLTDIQYQTIIDYCLNDIATRQPLYDELLKYIDESFESKQDKAEQLFAVMLFAQRDHKAGYPLFPYLRSDYNEYIKPELVKLGTVVAPAVFKYPLYYGTDTLKALASNNTEQFIGFCNVLYEQLLTQKLLHPHKTLLLQAATQDKLIKEECKKKLNRILTEQGKAIYTFICNLGGFCRAQTYQLGCSYGVVTGFSIRDVESLFGDSDTVLDDTKLEDVLKICLANNLLITHETKQGEKDKEWTVFYLNRWICAAFSLPLNFGGWRKRTVKELNDWMINDDKWETGIRM